jgi:hypothetical protein
MSPRLRQAIESEYALARQVEAAGRAAEAFRYLERAHVLSQRHTLAHVRSHLRMWGWAWRQRQLREILGQTTRILAAALFSRLWVPEGNTGGANVSAIRPMPIPDDLREILSR